MSFKEVEKERKLALDVHARIHEINKKFQPYLYSLVLFREASMYHATEADSKVYDLPNHLIILHIYVYYIVYSHGLYHATDVDPG